MTDNQIRSFLAVIQYENFTKAANSLFITEPALSKSILNLENELGCKLLIRKKGSRSLTLTEHGRAFIPFANEWMAMVRRIQNFNSSDARLPLRISATESHNYCLLSNVYHKYMAHNLDVHLLIDTLHSAEAIRQIEQNQCDLALISYVEDRHDLEFRKLFSEKIVLVCPKGMLPDGFVHPSDLEPSKEVLSSWAPDYKAWDEYWFGKEKSSRIFSKNSQLIPSFIEHHGMWTFAPITVANSWAEKHDFDIHDLSAAPPVRTCYAVQKNQFKHPAAEGFMEFLLDSLNDVPGIEIS